MRPAISFRNSDVAKRLHMPDLDCKLNSWCSRGIVRTYDQKPNFGSKKHKTNCYHNRNGCNVSMLIQIMCPASWFFWLQHSVRKHFGRFEVLELFRHLSTWVECIAYSNCLMPRYTCHFAVKCPFKQDRIPHCLWHTSVYPVAMSIFIYWHSYNPCSNNNLLRRTFCSDNLKLSFKTLGHQNCQICCFRCVPVFCAVFGSLDEIQGKHVSRHFEQKQWQFWIWCISLLFFSASRKKTKTFLKDICYYPHI